MKLITKYEFSSGGVVFRENDNSIEFLLGKHSGYHKWVLPKGLVEEGEDPRKTAIRETEEEVSVKARIINEEPLKNVEYFYFADLGQTTKKSASEDKISRRIIRYQENGGKKVRIHKKVSFYLMEYTSGDPVNHGWEMEDAGWFSYEDALSLLAFDTEKAALKAAGEKLNILKSTA